MRSVSFYALLTATAFSTAPALAAPSTTKPHIETLPRTHRATAPKTSAVSHTREDVLVRASSIVRAAHTIDKTTRDQQKIPQAITRIDKRVLEAEHIDSLTQAARLVPTLQVNSLNPLNTTVNIRGLGANGTSTTAGLEGGVAVYMDGVYRARPAAVFSAVPDLAGIDVIRGPAGTEGGMSATAGAVNLSSALPSFKREIYGEAGTGNFGYYRWMAGMSSRLFNSDKVAFRLSALGTGNEGWVKNSYQNGNFNATTTRSFRAQILAKPTDTFSIRIIGDYAHFTQAGQAFGLVTALKSRANGTVLPGNLWQRAANVGYTVPTPSNAPYTAERNSLSALTQEDMGLSAEMNWDVSRNVRLSSITAFRWYNWNPHSDADGLGVSVFDNMVQAVNQRQFTQELKASGHTRLVDWTVGGFYMWQENNVHFHTVYGNQAAQWFGLGQIGDLALQNLSTGGYAQPTTNDYALYGSATTHLTQKLNLITGIRYDYETKNGSYAQWRLTQNTLSNLPSALAAQAAALRNSYAPEGGLSGHMSNQFVTAQVNLVYQITPNISAYARYARGAKSGGLNLAWLPAGATTVVKAEKDDTAELGFKTNWFKNRLFLNGALFNSEDYNYQAPTVNTLPSGALTTYYGNVPHARSRGGEIDLHYAPVRNLITSISASYTDATYTNYKNAGCPPELSNLTRCDLSGTQLPFVPKWALSASVQYTHGLGFMGLPHLDGTVGGSYRYSTAINTLTNNSTYGWVPGYGTLNLNAGVKLHNDRLQLNAFIDNATNEKRLYQVTQYASAAGAFGGFVTQPLNFGFILKGKY